MSDLHHTEDEQSRFGRMAEKRVWGLWTLLAGLAISTTLGLAMSMATLITGQEIGPWPWASTELGLLICISVLVVVAALYLTRMQKKATEMHKRYLVLQEQVARQQTEFRFNAVLNTVGEGIITVSDELEILMANPEASRIWACPRNDLIGKDILELIHDHESGPSFREIIDLFEPDSNSLYRRRYQFTGRRNGNGKFPLEVAITRTDLNGIPHFTLAVRDITERVKAQERIRDLAFFDGLTGLPNRKFFFVTLQNTIELAARKKRKAGLLFLDLDGFKGVNDRLGHAAGDQLLGIVAERLSGCLRRSDLVGRPYDESVTVSRLGGDEFTVLLKEISRADNAAMICRRIQKALSQPITLNGVDVAVSSSIGISVFPEDGEDADTLMKNADAAMYSAKNRGPSQFEFYAESVKA